MDASGLIPSDRQDLVIHGWSKASAFPRRNPGVHIPAKVVAQKAKDVVLAPMRGKGRGWKSTLITAGSEHPGALNVIGDLSAKDFRAVVVYALEFEDMLLREMGGAPVNIPYSIKIYSDEKPFRAEAVMAGADNALSYYDPRTKGIVMYFDPKGPDVVPALATHDDLQDILSHEFTHSFMDIVWKRTSPLWFAEGMAEYFQHFEWKGGRATGGGISEKELLMLNRDPILPLREFVNVQRYRMYGSEFPQLYAQAWATTHFLINRHPNGIRAFLRGEHMTLDKQWLQEEWIEYMNWLYDKGR